ncbi:Pentatricopeptide repeat-containing protein At2g33680 [Linum perenne]
MPILHYHHLPTRHRSFFTLLLDCARHRSLSRGKSVHAQIVKNGDAAYSCVYTANSLVNLYAKCGHLAKAKLLFDRIPHKDVVSWNSLINGYAQSGDSQKALELFSTMHFAGVYPSEYTVVGVLNSCSDVAAVEEGKQVHSYLLKLGFETQMFILTALVDMYAKCGHVRDARRGFDVLSDPDIVLWTSMIAGYVQNGENEDGLSLYDQMRMQGVLPNELTMASLLKACSSLAALEQGKQIHGCIVKYGFTLEMPIGSTLSTMYAKCGSLDDANIAFRRMPERDILSWNAMISGLSHNGQGEEALQLFQDMRLEEGTKPDHITFVNILSACSHMGMIDKAWTYFNMMFDEFGIAPTIEHYACMVDVLSRAGQLKEAKDFIDSVPIDHGICLWRILLSACRNYRNYELGAYAGEKLMELGSRESSAYVLLSSIYIALRRPKEVERIRSLMRSRGANKDPGCSWIELKSLVHVFVVGDQRHPQIDEICGEIRRLFKQMKDEGYHPAPDLAA